MTKVRRVEQTAFPTAHAHAIHPKLALLADWLTGRVPDAPEDCEGLAFNDSLVLVREIGVGCQFALVTRYCRRWFEVFSVHPSDAGSKALRDAGEIVVTPPSHFVKVQTARREAERNKAKAQAMEHQRKYLGNEVVSTADWSHADSEAFRVAKRG